MDETILPPSPNWFQVSGLAVSTDGWIVYGGPSKSLCVLEPLHAEHRSLLQGPKYHAHVFTRVNSEKIVSVDISPDWPDKQMLLTGSADGSVKHWNLSEMLQTRKAKSTLSHEIHSQDKEEIAGVGYSNEVYAVTVGSFGNVVKWDLVANIAKTYAFCRNFKPLCMACSPHIPLNVAIGTKQGVVFLLDLTGNGKILYKVRGQDDEIININWCPQYEVALKKTLKESEMRANVAKKDDVGKKEAQETKPVKEILDKSGEGKNLPDDSFDDTLVEVAEDDMFDIYADHAADEFGHKKYEPEEIYVKVQAETEKVDYLAECSKLKEEILKRKTEDESDMQSLVDTLDNTHVDSNQDEASASCSKVGQEGGDECDQQNIDVASAHIHRHLLATISKHGSVRIWSKSGKLVGSCAVSSVNTKNQKHKLPNWPTLLWYKPDMILISDGKSQLVECNPLKIDCKNKLDWTVVHSLHKRGLFSITSTAPRVQTGKESADWQVFTASQDRNIIQYSMQKREKTAVIATCGGFVYTVLPCPYDAGKLAVSVGDGAVRVWETTTLEEDETKLAPGHWTSYWQNVQGKVLTVAWHPTRENLLAFATAESRIGLIDTSSKTERPARVLLPALSGGVYSICWGEGHDLYACSNGHLVVYQANKPDEAPVAVRVELEGQRWEVSYVRRRAAGLVCGGSAGAVAVLAGPPTHEVLAATIVFSKMIHMIDWHPQQTSDSSEESPHKNLLAVCSMEKQGTIVILEYSEKEDGSKQLQTYKTLSGHKSSVSTVQWNPHREAQLLSTSQDTTVRVWDAVSGVCTSIFGGHSVCALGAAWAALPPLGARVLSGGGDCALRCWRAPDHPAAAYDENLIAQANKREKKKFKKDKKTKSKEQENAQAEEPENTEERVAVRNLDVSLKGPKKFLMPMLHRPKFRDGRIHSFRLILHKYLKKNHKDNNLIGKVAADIKSMENKYMAMKQEKAGDSNSEESVDGDSVGDEAFSFDYLKIFGTLKEVNEFLDAQMEQHMERNNFENWATLAIFRGHIDAMIQRAGERDALCPFLLSMAPSVSYKYWKDATQLYVAQIDRLVAKGEEKKLDESRKFGGAVYRKAAALLGVHDVRGALAALADARLLAEAYALCRTRHMESIAEKILILWAEHSAQSGLFIDAAMIYVLLQNLPQAAKHLGKVKDQECLELATEIAKIAGQNMLVEHLSEIKKDLQNTESVDPTEEILGKLPSRMELLMKEGEEINGESNLEENKGVVNVVINRNGETKE